MIFLGADTPLETLHTSVEGVHPTLIVLVTVDHAIFHKNSSAIATLAASAPVAVAAPVDEQAIAATGAEPLIGEIPDIAAALVRRRPSR